MHIDALTGEKPRLFEDMSKMSYMHESNRIRCRSFFKDV